MLPLPSIPFSPTLDELESLLADIRSTELSFTQLADRYHTSADALADFVSHPDIRERLDDTAGAACYRTRLIAAEKLPHAVNALSNILIDFNADHAQGALPADPILRHRDNETARKCAASIMRLLRITHAPTREASAQPDHADHSTPKPAPIAHPQPHISREALIEALNEIAQSLPDEPDEAAPAADAFHADGDSPAPQPTPVPNKTHASPRPLQRPCSLVDPGFSRGSDGRDTATAREELPAGRFSGLPEIPALAAAELTTRARDPTGPPDCLTHPAAAPAPSPAAPASRPP